MSDLLATLEAIADDCERWLNDESDISAEDLIAAIRDTADAAAADGHCAATDDDSRSNGPRR